MLKLTLEENFETDGELCSNCRSVKGSGFLVRNHQNGMCGAMYVNLCPACKETYLDYAYRFDELMVLTPSWSMRVSSQYSNDPFLIRLLALLRGIFLFVGDENWKIDKTQIWIRLNSECSVKFVIGTNATSAMIVRKDDKKLELKASIQRMSLRNNDWYDFVGWVNNARTWYNITFPPEGTGGFVWE